MASQPPWAVDSGSISRGRGLDPNLRTKDINIPYRPRPGPRNSSSLHTQDIVFPKRRHFDRNWNGTPISPLNTRDIAGQHNKRAHLFGPGLKAHGSGWKPYNSLEVRDIDGAYAQRLRDPRNTCPLEPQYKLPSHHMAPAPEPTFIRDNVTNQDIRGAQFISKYAHVQTKQTNNVNDIKGAAGMKLTFNRTFGHAKGPLDHRDITDTEFKTKRRGHDPQNPCYTFGKSSDLNVATILDMPSSEALKATLKQAGPLTDNQPRTIGPIKGTKPTPIKKQKPLEYRSLPLRTSDVDGAYVGWMPEWKPPRKYVNRPTRTDDIPGAQPGTKKRLVTKRNTNPIYPRYQMLGGRKNGRGGQLSSTGREISQIQF